MQGGPRRGTADHGEAPRTGGHVCITVWCVTECRGPCPLPDLYHSLRLLVYGKGGEEQDGG
jgi:hypothetical protein